MTKEEFTNLMTLYRDTWRRTGNGLKKVTYQMYTAIEQNPIKLSPFAKLARQGHKVIQIFSFGRYYGVVIDSEFFLYSKPNYDSEIKILDDPQMFKLLRNGEYVGLKLLSDLNTHYLEKVNF